MHIICPISALTLLAGDRKGIQSVNKHPLLISKGSVLENVEEKK